MVVLEFRARAVLRKFAVVVAGATLLAMAWMGESRTPSTAGLLTTGPSAEGGGALPTSGASGTTVSITTEEKKVALTFELDRGEIQFREILRSLETEGVRATFFVAGTWGALHPDELKLIAREGHEIGLLGYRQIDLTGLPAAEIRSEIRNAQLVFGSAADQKPRLFRPPLGRWDGSVLRETSALGLTPVMWTVDSHDSQRVSPKYISRRLLSAAAPGAVFRLHAGDKATQTAAALPDLIRGLRSRGFEIIPAGELLDAPTASGTG